MRIYLFLANKLLTISLPEEISGSFSFDEVDTESKLINIEARDNKWVLYSTIDSKVISNGNPVESTEITSNTFYILNRDNKQYLIYAVDALENVLYTYKYDQNINLLIGNDNNCNIRYNCEYINGLIARIYFKDNRLLLEIGNNNLIYINNKITKNQLTYLKIGDTVNIFGLKIIILSNTILINSQPNRLSINEQLAKIVKFNYPAQEPNQNIEIKDKELYSKEEYYSKSPRIRRIIETKNWTNVDNGYNVNCNNN